MLLKCLTTVLPNYMLSSVQTTFSIPSVVVGLQDEKAKCYCSIICT